jgi:cytochrome c peroxidase
MRNRVVTLLAAACWCAAAGAEPARLPVPPPGSYALPSLGAAADGAVLDTDGAETSLHALFDDRVVLLAFVYSSCGDAEGCPLATASLHRLGRMLEGDPRARARLRVLSLSFDPEHDTPARLREVEQGVERAGLDWRFLTTRSRGALDPILAAYGQALARERDAEGRETGAIAHVLRVFLIDPAGRIRNIYSSSYLEPDLLLTDVRSLLLEPTGGRP